MVIREVEYKRDYLPLLLLADEQENMIDLYLDRGKMFVLEDDGDVKAECVITDEGEGVSGCGVAKASHRRNGRCPDVLQ